MKTLFKPVILMMMLASIPVAIYAQWPSYRTPGVPRTPDGKPILNGPTPRMPDGKPDLSGVWEDIRVGRGPGRGKGKAAPPPQPTDGPPLATFFNVGANIKGGLPFTPWAAALKKQRMAANDKDNPDAHCLPLGLMQLHMHPQPRKIVQTPNEVIIMYEAQAGLRQIFTDGRPLPNNDPEPWWYGYSVGHWEGDTLVVETVGFRDDVWLDVDGSPLTNSGKMIERFRRPDYGHLNIDVTIEDPKAYTKPFTVRVQQKIMPDTELIEFICSENEQSDAHLVGK
jgi:hypothetical protein